jgi:hypothetical protein
MPAHKWKAMSKGDRYCINDDVDKIEETEKLTKKRIK